MSDLNNNYTTQPEDGKGKMQAATSAQEHRELTPEERELVRRAVVNADKYLPTLKLVLKATDIFLPVIIEEWQKMQKERGIKIKASEAMKDIDAVFMGSFAEWMKVPQPLTRETVRPVVIDVLRQYFESIEKDKAAAGESLELGDDVEAVARRIIDPRKVVSQIWSSTSTFSRAAVKLENWTGAPKAVTVRNAKSGRRVQRMILTQFATSERRRMEFSQDISTSDLLMLQAASNASASLIQHGATWLPPADIARLIKGGSDRQITADFVDRVIEIIELGRHTTCTIYEPYDIDENGKPKNPDQRLGEWLNDVIFPFAIRGGYSNRHVIAGYEPHGGNALPLFTRAAMRIKQTVEIQSHWIDIPQASLTEDRLFAVNYLLENVMLMKGRQNDLIRHVANRNRRNRWKELTQTERERNNLQSLREFKKDKRLEYLTFDRMFETLDISDTQQKRRLINFLTDWVLPYWKEDATMPILDYEIVKDGRQFRSIKFKLNPPV